jgi:hypothetical protein
MKYKLALLIIVLFLVACTPQTTKVPTNYKTGIQSLTLTIEQQQKQLFEDETTTLPLSLHNKGASDILGGIYSLTVDNNLLELQQETITDFDLPGKTEFNPLGDEDIIGITVTAKKLPPQTETITTTLTINACYPYTTTTTQDVCIDTDLLGKESNKPCQTKTIRLSSQGSPIAITSIASHITAHQDKQKVIPEFTISIKNKGTGQVFAADKVIEACTSGSLGKAWNQASVTAYLGDTQLACIPVQEGLIGRVNLEKENIVKCKVVDGIQTIRGTYITPLTIEITYGYTTILTKDIEVRTLQ